MKAKAPIRYQYLQQWMGEQKPKISRKKLAEDVGMISIQGSWNGEKGMPTEWFNIWQKKYHWTQEQKMMFAFDEKIKTPKEEPTLERGFEIMMKAWQEKKEEEAEAV